MSATKLADLAVEFARNTLNVDGSIVSNDRSQSLDDLESILAGWPGRDGDTYRWRWRQASGRKVKKDLTDTHFVSPKGDDRG